MVKDWTEDFDKERKKYEDSDIKTAKTIGKWIFSGIAFIFIIILFFSAFYIVSAGERGILSTFGNPSMDAKAEGLHFKIPMVQGITIMDVKTQKYEADLSAASKDLQIVNTKIAINYRLVPESVPIIYKTIGTNYRESVIYPLEQEANKAATAQFTAEELITKREQVREMMKANLQEKLSSRGIIIEEVSIVNFDFSPSFNEAIEKKVTAEQNALAAKNKLEQIKFEAEQKVVTAEAEAKALALQKAQITPDLIALRQLEVQKLAIEKWNGQMPTITGGVMPFIDVNTMTSSAKPAAVPAA
jgi:regulator of protease activity HflC (stomatin/prohibitin superfamily)